MTTDAIKVVLFDLDGTLVNTLADLTDGVNHAMRLHGFPQHTTEKIQTFVGNGLNNLVRMSVPTDCDTATYEDCLREMLEYYNSHSVYKSRPYTGILELLERLQAAGRKMGVLTNKKAAATKTIVDEFFAGYIDFIASDDDKLPRKPAPDGIFVAAKHFDVGLENIVLVGDSETDVLTAKNAGIKVISILWGFRSKQAIQDSGGYCFAHNCDDVYKIIMGG